MAAARVPPFLEPAGLLRGEEAPLELMRVAAQASLGPVPLLAERVIPSLVGPPQALIPRH